MPLLKFLWCFKICLPAQKLFQDLLTCAKTFFFVVFVSVVSINLFRKKNYHRAFAHY